MSDDLYPFWVGQYYPMEDGYAGRVDEVTDVDILIGEKCLVCDGPSTSVIQCQVRIPIREASSRINEWYRVMDERAEERHRKQRNGHE